MFMKLIAAAAATLVLSGTALAQADSGFENGLPASGWGLNTAPDYVGNLSIQAYGSNVTVYDDYDAAGDLLLTPTPYSFSVSSAGADFGSSFGLLDTGSVTQLGYRVNTTIPATGGTFAFQLFSMDYDAAYNDEVKVIVNGTQVSSWSTDLTFNESLTVPGHPGIGASGWKTFAVAAGVTSIDVVLQNDVSGGNSPLVALDYAPTTAVPEPESMAMMLAGLGALGFVARRRKTQSV